MSSLCPPLVRLSLVALSVLAAAIGLAQAPQLATVAVDPPNGFERAVQIGEMDGQTKLHLSVSLPYRDPAGMQRFVDSVSDPKNPNYRHFLTPDQVGARFGLPAASIKSVSDYLAARGMTIRLVAKSGTAILADCTVAQAEAAFHTRIAEFASSEIKLHPGQKLFSYTSKLAVPANIAPLILHIGGMDSFTRGQGQQFINPDQLRVLYNVAPTYGKGFQGQGRTIAISSFDGFFLPNVPLEYAQFGFPTPAGGVSSNVTVEAVNPTEAGQNGARTGEGDLDIQCALAIAPLCHLIIYDGGNLATFWDPIGTLTKEADDDLADIVTESYLWIGGTQFYLALHNQHLVMNAEGMTYMACSGDHGAPGVAALPYPDMDPEVLSIGGTTITTDLLGNRVTETAWNLTDELGDGTLWGGGGGWFPSPNSFDVLPPYQKGLGIPTNIPYRLLPDVSLDADFSYEIFLDGFFQPFQNIAWGGTSCASPTFAGSLADVEERLISTGSLLADAKGHRRLGRLQDLLYSQNGNPKVFFDVISGKIGKLPNGTIGTAAVGWDFATGLGVVNFDGLYTLLATVPKMKTLTLSSASVEGGGPTSVTGTLTLSGLVGTPAYTVALASSDPSVVVPKTVTVNPGTTSVTFAVTTKAVTTAVSGKITASFGGGSISTTLLVEPAKLASVTLSGKSLYAKGQVTGSVSLSAAAPTGGVTVPLTLSNSTISAISPVSIKIAAGGTTATFTLTAKGVDAATAESVTATLNGATKTASVTIEPSILSGMTSSLTTALGGVNNALIRFTLNAPAGPSGVKVTLATSPATAAAFGVATVTIPAGSTTSAPTTLFTYGVAKNTTVSVKGTAVVSKAIAVVVTPALLTGFTVSPTSIQGNGTRKVTGTVTLNGPAGPIARVVTLTSSAAAAGIPSNVTIPANAKSATFTFVPKAVPATIVCTLTAQLASASLPATLTITH